MHLSLLCVIFCYTILYMLVLYILCMLGTNNANSPIPNIRGNYFVIDVDTLRG